MLHAVYFVAH